MPQCQRSCRLNLVTIRVGNLDRAERVYRALGMNFERHRHGTGPVHLCADSNGYVFELYPIRSGKSSTASIRLGFAVADVDLAVERMIAANGTVVVRPGESEWGYRAVVRDTDGHSIELVAAASVQ